MTTTDDEPEPTPDDALRRALEENRRRSEAMAESYRPPMRPTEPAAEPGQRPPDEGDPFR